MNRFYLIVPVVMSLLFGGVYWQHSTHAAEVAKVKAEQVAKAKADEEAKKAEAERKAREDAEKRTAARVAEEKKKEEDKQAKWAADGAKIAEDTVRYTDQASAYTKEIGALEKELAAIRAAKEQAGKEVFAQAREVELALIAKRNSELEIQRLTEMVARKAAGTSLVKTP